MIWTKLYTLLLADTIIDQLRWVKKETDVLTISWEMNIGRPDRLRMEWEKWVMTKIMAMNNSSLGSPKLNQSSFPPNASPFHKPLDWILGGSVRQILVWFRVPSAAIINNKSDKSYKIISNLSRRYMIDVKTRKDIPFIYIVILW